MAEVHLLRHAHYVGHSPGYHAPDNAALSPAGQRDTIQVAQALPPVIGLVSSSLPRALQTAKILAHHASLPVLSVNADLREWRSPSAIRGVSPRDFPEDYAQWRALRTRDPNTRYGDARALALFPPGTANTPPFLHMESLMSQNTTRFLSGWTISWDLCGTLITNGDRELASAWRIREFGRILREHGHRLATDVLSEIVGRTREAAKHQQRTTQAQPTVESQVGALLDELAIERDQELVDLLIEVHTHAVLQACPQPMPGMDAALTMVKAAGGRVVLTSNTLATSPAVHRRLLADLGWLDMFHATLFSGDLGIAKPHPDVFAAVAERAECPLERIVHIGNDLRTDVDGALGAGCHALHYNPHRVTARPDVSSFTHPAELASLLFSLCGNPNSQPTSRSDP